jgi:hypothetical protein
MTPCDLIGSLFTSVFKDPAVFIFRLGSLVPRRLRQQILRNFGTYVQGMITLKTRSLFVRYEILTAANINIGDYCLMGVTPYSLVNMYEIFQRNLLLVSLV